MLSFFFGLIALIFIIALLMGVLYIASIIIAVISFGGLIFNVATYYQLKDVNSSKCPQCGSQFVDVSYTDGVGMMRCHACGYSFNYVGSVASRNLAKRRAIVCLIFFLLFGFIFLKMNAAKNKDESNSTASSTLTAIVSPSWIDTNVDNSAFVIDWEA